MATFLAPCTVGHYPRKSARFTFFALALALAASAVAPPPAQARTWTDNTGNYQVEAEYVGLVDGKVRLKKTDGTVIGVPLERLSESDRAYVQRQSSREPNENSAEDIPIADNVEASVSFTTEEGRFPVLSFGNEDADTPLRGIVRLRGSAVAEASAYGQVEIQEARYPDDRSLKEEENPLSFGDPREAFVPIDRQMMYLGEADWPDDEIKFELLYQEPPAGVEKVAEFQGSVVLLTGGTRKTVPIEDVASQTEQEISSPTLDDTGIRVQTVRPDSDSPHAVAFRASGRTENLLGVELVDSSGSEITAQGTKFHGDRHIEWTIEPEQALPGDATLELTAVVDATPVRVPLEFEDVSIED